MLSSALLGHGASLTNGGAALSPSYLYTSASAMQRAAGELIFLEVSVIKLCAERKTIKASCRKEKLLVIFFHEREQGKKNRDQIYFQVFGFDPDCKKFKVESCNYLQKQRFFFLIRIKFG